MFLKLKTWRRKHFPTKTEQFQDLVTREQERYNLAHKAGYDTADKIIKKAPKHVAIEVITRKQEGTNPGFADGMQARLLKEEW